MGNPAFAITEVTRRDAPRRSRNVEIAACRVVPYRFTIILIGENVRTVS